MRKNDLEISCIHGKHRKLFLIFNLTLLLVISCFIQAFAQQTVTGKVLDKNGQPLPGVTVIVKGTTMGSVTNNEGTYSIADVPAGAVLNFTFVGMQTQDIIPGTQTSINVTMVEEAIGLNEVVVTALGIKKESKSLGYATSQVTSDQLTINRTRT